MLLHTPVIFQKNVKIRFLFRFITLKHKNDTNVLQHQSDERNRLQSSGRWFAGLLRTSKGFFIIPPTGSKTAPEHDSTTTMLHCYSLPLYPCSLWSNNSSFVSSDHRTFLQKAILIHVVSLKVWFSEQELLFLVSSPAIHSHVTHSCTVGSVAVASCSWQAMECAFWIWGFSRKPEGRTRRRTTTTHLERKGYERNVQVLESYIENLIYI